MLLLLKQPQCGWKLYPVHCAENVLPEPDVVRVLSAALRDTGDLCRPWRPPRFALRTDNTLTTSEVEIELPESAVLKGSLLVYFAPLLFAIAAVLLVQSYGEFATVLAFVVGLAAGFAVVRATTHWLLPRESFEPRLSSVIQPPTSVANHGVIARH